MNPLRAVVAAAVLAAIAPSTAFASTWTVDDDKADCPNARFTSIQAAVDQAAPWDTVVICAGTYIESSTPTSGNNSPSQAGSKNGLTITKPLTLKGAGANKVTIKPASALAGTAPYLRDGGGNVVTISRQSLGSTDDNENFVDISGVTIDSGGVPAEALVAFFNTSGRIANSVLGTVTPAGPYGYGLIMTNSLQGASEAGVRRQVTLEKSVLSAGGIFFDDARGADGTATTTARSGITAYGNIVGSRVAGPVTYTYGQRGLISGSELAGALTLTDAELGPDPSNPAVRAFSVTGSSLASLANSGTGTALATGNWWGAAGPTTTGLVDAGSPLAAAPASLSVPAPTLDALPTGTIVDPVGPTVVPYGETIYPVVVAGDDFGVKSVSLTANGAPVASIGHTPYEFTWTPAYGDIGDTVVLAAKITDSSGQTSVVSTEVKVPAITTDAPGTVTGAVPATLALTVGAPASFGAFTPGIAKTYTATTTANVVSTAGDAVLSVVDPSATAPGHLVNGAFVLPSALQARARNAANTGTAFNTVSGSPLNLLAWSAPISNDAVTLEFAQPVAANDALRTGTYAKTLTFTLSTTTP
ncbi:Ig-like domain-containing protein [Solirubrobacter soli]|uniref:Ig-like domain-containing protein n=1 Tax=Solirubrobacter soli TaxID=363832 RepID=UPI0004062BD0|nr:Ig-like domain-containing protein [Solirubrobacter soli]